MEAMMDNSGGFEHLPLARTDMNHLLEGAYRIYTDKKNYTTIQASSAIEALEMSGIHYAFKIKRENLFSNNLLNPKSWDKAVAATAAVVAETPIIQEAAPTEAVAETAAPAAELSNHDVDKLLNG